VLAVLGPNGAGKTTAVRILATLLQPDEGRALVGGYDVVAQAQQVRRLIALTGQYAAVDESLTGVENLLMLGRLLGQSRAAARRRAAELLEQFSLADAGGRAVKTYSGGMRRRLDLAASLVGRPRVLYLDEPTTGLDPRARSDLWEVVRALTSDGGGGRIGQGRTPPQGQGLAQQGPRPVGVAAQLLAAGQGQGLEADGVHGLGVHGQPVAARGGLEHPREQPPQPRDERLQRVRRPRRRVVLPDRVDQLGRGHHPPRVERQAQQQPAQPRPGHLNGQAGTGPHLQRAQDGNAQAGHAPILPRPGPLASPTR
jgi:ABC-type transport system involved in cytochrome c biogenesis ATPase subunit